MKTRFQLVKKNNNLYRVYEVMEDSTGQLIAYYNDPVMLSATSIEGIEDILNRIKEDIKAFGSVSNKEVTFIEEDEDDYEYEDEILDCVDMFEKGRIEDY